MTEQEINEAIEQIAEHYGVKALAEEIADVRILMTQLMQFYGIPETEMATLVERKLERQLERIKGEQQDDDKWFPQDKYNAYDPAPAQKPGEIEGGNPQKMRDGDGEA